MGKDKWRQLLKAVIEGALTPTLLIDKKGKIIFHSISLEKLWQVEGGFSLDHFNFLEDKLLQDAGIMPMIQTALSGKTAQSVEVFFNPAQAKLEGRPRYIKVQAYPVETEAGAVDCIVIVMEDITGQRKDEKQAFHDIETLKNFMNSASDALVIYDNELNYVEINKIAQEQIGKKHSQIIGKNIIDILPGIEKTSRYKQYLRLIQEGGQYAEEVSNHPYIPGRIVLIKAFKLKDGLGITTADITSSKKELQRELNLNRDLEILKDSALDLVELSLDDDLYGYTAGKLSDICDNSFVLINVFDQKLNKVIVKGIDGDKKIHKKLNSLPGGSLLGKYFPHIESKDLLRTKKISLLNQSLYEISGGEIPEQAERTLVETFGLDEIYRIGFYRKDIWYGYALIFTNSNKVELNTPLIEAFINQISIAIHRNVTESALLESEKRFEIAFSTSPDSVNINRISDGTYIDVNEGFSETTGYSREEIIGCTSFEKEIWVNIEDRKELIKELKKKGFIKNLEAEFRTKNDEIRVGLMSAQLFIKDGIEYIISITRDISKRIEAERSLKTNEERYRIVARQTGQIIYDYNILSGDINWVGAIEEVTKFTPEEFSKINISEWEDLVHPDDAEQTLEILDKAIKKGNPFDAEYRLKRKDGKYIFIEEHGICIKGANNNTYRMLGSMADITERKENQNRLEYAWRKAEESDKLKTAFLANLSHEIRTPMNAILGFSDMLMERQVSDSNQAEYIGMINKSSHNLLNIINDIIDFSMLETGQLQIFNRECSLINIVHNLHDIFNQYKLIENKEHLDIKLGLPMINTMDIILADEERIKQVMSNLIGNAIKYTDTGEIKFGYGIKEESNENPMIEFYVSDTGVGIEKEKHQVIFERFRQLEYSNTRKYGGNGLGLSISKEIANLMGGDIYLKSTPGEGSVFYFTLPYQPALILDSKIKEVNN